MRMMPQQMATPMMVLGQTVNFRLQATLGWMPPALPDLELPRKVKGRNGQIGPMLWCVGLPPVSEKFQVQIPSYYGLLHCARCARLGISSQF